MATAAIALRADRVEALADTVQIPALTPEVPPLNVCAATARRLLEIARRNEIRREAKLPLLPIAKELRRMKTAGRIGGVRAVPSRLREGGVGGGSQAASRSGGQPELASELDGGYQLSNPGEQNSLGAILRGTPSGESEIPGRRTL